MSEVLRAGVDGVPEFRLAASHGKNCWEGKPDAANRAYAELQSVEHDLAGAEPGAVRDALAPLLAHDPYVRVAAAVWMLKFDPGTAVPVLERLDGEYSGGWHMTAHYVLEAFRDGTYLGGA